MDSLIEHRSPGVKLPNLIVAFAGWPDAGEAATRAVRYLVRKLPAKKFAEIDPEEFYEFTSVRPQVRVNRKGERSIRWPANDFYYYATEDESRGLLIYIGTEPNLRWRTFSNIIIGVARQHGVEFVTSVGALLDAVPHTREPRVTGRATGGELAKKVEWLGVRNSSYQGPVGIHTAFTANCEKAGLPSVSLWGHSPHYLKTSPNPKVSYALLTKLRSVVEFDVDLKEMRLAAEAFEEEVTKAMSKQAGVGDYVRRLEERYDQDHESPGDIPSPDDMVKELEDFLKSQRNPPTGREDAE